MKYKKHLNALLISTFAVFALMFGSVHSAGASFWDWFGAGGGSQQEAQVNQNTLPVTSSAPGRPSVPTPNVPSVEWSLVKTDVKSNPDVNVDSSSVTATITLKAVTSGRMKQPVSTDFSFVFASTTQTNGAYTSANSVSVIPTVQVQPLPIGSITYREEYIVTLTGTIYSSNPKIGSSQYLFGAIKDIDSTVDGKTIINQNWGIDTFHTNPAYLPKGKSSSSAFSSSSTSSGLTVTTNDASLISTNDEISTYLLGKINNPNKENISYYFNYRKETEPSTETKQTGWYNGGSYSLVDAFRYVKGLAPDTKYVYQLYVYSHTTGKTVSGELKSFITPKLSGFYINLLSPNGGEILKEGENYKIRWNLGNVPAGAKVKISLRRADKADKEIVANIPYNQYEYIWKVDTVSGWGLGYDKKPSTIAKLLGIKTADAKEGYSVIISVQWNSSDAQKAFYDAYDQSDYPFDIVSGDSSSSQTSAVPTVSTGYPTNVTTSSATLNGMIDPKDKSTQVYFEIFPDPNGGAYGMTTSKQSVSNSLGNQSFSANISNLKPGTTYTYYANVIYYDSTTGTNKIITGAGKTVTTLSSSSSVGNLPPVITGSTVPSTLNVGETGIWKINVSDPENGYLSYDVCWEDYLCQQIDSNRSLSANNFTQTATFSHAYNKAGTYNVLITVIDDKGNSAKTSYNVRVVASTNSYIFTRELGLGSSGDDVAELQKRLTSEGHYSGPITGYYGLMTGEAVRKYQIRNNLPATGYVGQQTLAVLNGSNSTNKAPSISQIVELFITLGIISPDKAEQARAAIKGI